MSIRNLLPAMIIPFILFSTYAISDQGQVPSSPSVEKSSQIVIQEKPSDTMNILIPFISAILGGLAGAGISIYFSKRQATQEYRPLILSFSSEMVSTFWRCVKYHKQYNSGEISYSSLFSFTDASILSRFASVCKKPEVVAAIIELKSMYFQVQRHVEEASRCAIESRSLSIGADSQQLMKRALSAQGAALSFFKSSYKNIVKEMDLIVQTAMQVAPGSVADSLYSKYNEAKSEKKKVDEEVENKKKKATEEHNHLML